MSVLRELAKQRPWHRVIWERIIGIVYEDDWDSTALMELYFSGLAIRWAYVIFATDIRDNPLFLVMEKTPLTLQGWGVLCLSLGVCSLATLVMDWQRERRLCAGFRIWLWATFAVCMWYAKQSSWFSYAWTAFLCVTIEGRLRRRTR